MSKLIAGGGIFQRWLLELVVGACHWSEVVARVGCQQWSAGGMIGNIRERNKRDELW